MTDDQIEPYNIYFEKILSKKFKNFTQGSNS